MQLARTDAESDTFPKLLLQHAKVRGNQPAIREKDLGIWQSWTWAQVRDEVAALAGGLAAMGFRRGDNLAIIGDNRPRLYWAMSAAQALGGVPVPLYQDAPADEIIYVFDNAEIGFAIVEDQEQVDKLLEIKPRAPRLNAIIYDDPRGLRHYQQPFLHAYTDVQARGREYHAAHPDFLADSIGAGKSADTAVILYTSGTTGHPKGVCHTHASMMGAGARGCEFEKLGPGDEILSYLPMAWVGDFLFSYAQAMAGGFTVNCPESPDTVMTDLREIGPTYYFAPPRVYENLLTTVMIRMEDASWLKRGMFRWLMNVANRSGVRILARQPVPLLDRVLYALGNLLVYGPLRDVLGMSRIRVAYTAGEAIGPDLFRFYRSIGINLKQFYGQTETCAYVCLQADDQVKFDSVGVAAPGMQIRIAENGEVLVKGVSLLKEYYKRPDATADAIDADGYFMTGDAGVFGSDGHLKIIDRAKDVGRMNDGTLFAPKYLENKLKFSSHIKEAVAFGDQRGYCAAFINIDIGAVGDWAERRNMPYTGYTDLASQDAVYDLIKDCVEKVNRDLADDPSLCNSQIRRFLILHKELDADDGELTRTRKVRRGALAEKYAELIAALYSEQFSCRVTAQVRFEDGRTGTIVADVKIREARLFEALQKAS